MIVQVSNFKYLCLRPPSLLSRSRMTLISVLTGLYTLSECPLHRNTKTYTRPENNQAKNVDLAIEKSSFERSTRKRVQAVLKP